MRLFLYWKVISIYLGLDYTDAAALSPAGADYSAAAGEDYSAAAGEDYSAAAGEDYSAAAGEDYARILDIKT